MPDEEHDSPFRDSSASGSRLAMANKSNSPCEFDTELLTEQLTTLELSQLQEVEVESEQVGELRSSIAGPSSRQLDIMTPIAEMSAEYRSSVSSKRGAHSLKSQSTTSSRSLLSSNRSRLDHTLNSVAEVDTISDRAKFGFDVPDIAAVSDDVAIQMTQTRNLGTRLADDLHLDLSSHGGS